MIRLRHFFVLCCVLSTSSLAAARAQIVLPADESDVLDLTLHARPESLTRPDFPPASDCTNRPGIKTTAASRKSLNSTNPASGVLAPDPLTPLTDECAATDSSLLTGKPQYTEAFNEKIRWRPIFTQSLQFLLIEHGFRFASDSYARYLLFHKPFWNDWSRSVQHFDMSRWSDGDDFLVNYVGHPLEGAVSGRIFIQNDPRGRAERFGKSGSYWKSRLRAMAWAAAYSAYFEMGPVLSEAAFGNEGGFTYVPKCGLAPCSIPGRKLKPPTNNTGWVDFVVTPTVGIGWIVLEDAIEEKIVNPLAGDSPSLAWRIVRGSLAPSHTMSNFLQGKLPWYRPWLYENPTGPQGDLFVKSEKRVDPTEGRWQDQPRKAIGIHYVNLNLPMDWGDCYKCRVSSSGLGATAAYRLTKRLWFDSEINQFLASTAQNGHSSATQGLFGVRYGYTGRTWSIYAKVRPGFIYYPKTISYPSGDQFVSLTRFAFDAGTIMEMKASTRSAFRLDAGVTFIRYLQGLDPRQPPVAVISPNYIATQGNFQIATGYVFRF